jgi:hypothetical protein
MNPSKYFYIPVTPPDPTGNQNFFLRNSDLFPQELVQNHAGFTNWPNYNKHMKIRHNTDLCKRSKKKEMEQNCLQAHQNRPENVVQSVIPNIVTFEIAENT